MPNGSIYKEKFFTESLTSKLLSINISGNIEWKAWSDFTILNTLLTNMNS